MTYTASIEGQEPMGSSKETEKEVREDLGEMTSEAIIAEALASAPRNALLRHPLLRKPYLIAYVLFALFFYLPYWTLLYLSPANRPRASWTLQRCLRVRWSRALCALVARCEVDYLGRDLNLDLDPLRLSHSHPLDIPPAPPTHLVGHPAETLAELHRTRGAWIPKMVHRSNPDAEAAWGRWNDVGDRQKEYGFEAVKGFWFAGTKERPTSSLPPRQPGDPVGIHFHGGGYLCGTAAETDLTSSIAKALVAHSPIHHILAVDYRLAPTSPWPLPLLDAISSYHYLVHVEGVPEGDIILIGDSAGGHLALALTRWLRDSGAQLGYSGPKGLVLLSPWVDVGFTTAWGEGKYHNASSDLIDDSFGPFATSLLLRALPPSLMHTSEYLSPASLLIPSHPRTFADFPPCYVVHGTAERLSTSIETFWSRLQLSRKADEARKGRPASTPDKHTEGVDCVHDFMIFPWQSEEAAEVYADMDVWLRDLLSDDAGSSGSVTPTDSADAITLSPEILAMSPDLKAGSPRWDPTRSPLLSSHTVAPHPWSKRERRASRQSLKSLRSPSMGPTHPGVGSMMGDMRSEAWGYMNLPSLDLDLISPLVGQVEGGEWDWGAGEGVGENESGEEGARKGTGERGWYDVHEEDGEGGHREGEKVQGESRKER